MMMIVIFILTFIIIIIVVGMSLRGTYDTVPTSVHARAHVGGSPGGRAGPTSVDDASYRRDSRRHRSVRHLRLQLADLTTVPHGADRLRRRRRSDFLHCGFDAITQVRISPSCSL